VNSVIQLVQVFSSVHVAQYAEQGLHSFPLKYIPETHLAAFEQVPLLRVKLISTQSRHSFALGPEHLPQFASHFRHEVLSP
jgi:hypothetical protein